MNNEPKKIITSPIFPPIPVRGLDWAATFDGYEPGDHVGHGATEQEAIDDLLKQVEGDPAEWSRIGDHVYANEAAKSTT